MKARFETGPTHASRAIQLGALAVVLASCASFPRQLDYATVRSPALTAGYEVTDRPYEAWKSGVAGAFTENGQFDVYWALK